MKCTNPFSEHRLIHMVPPGEGPKGAAEAMPRVPDLSAKVKEAEDQMAKVLKPESVQMLKDRKLDAVKNIGEKAKAGDVAYIVERMRSTELLLAVPAKIASLSDPAKNEVDCVDVVLRWYEYKEAEKVLRDAKTLPKEKIENFTQDLQWNWRQEKTKADTEKIDPALAKQKAKEIEYAKKQLQELEAKRALVKRLRPEVTMAPLPPLEPAARPVKNTETMQATAKQPTNKPNPAEAPKTKPEVVRFTLFQPNGDITLPSPEMETQAYVDLVLAIAPALDRAFKQIQSQMPGVRSPRQRAYMQAKMQQVKDAQKILRDTLADKLPYIAELPPEFRSREWNINAMLTGRYGKEFPELEGRPMFFQMMGENDNNYLILDPEKKEWKIDPRETLTKKGEPYYPKSNGGYTLVGGEAAWNKKYDPRYSGGLFGRDGTDGTSKEGQKRRETPNEFRARQKVGGRGPAEGVYGKNGQAEATKYVRKKLQDQADFRTPGKETPESTYVKERLLSAKEALKGEGTFGTNADAAAADRYFVDINRTLANWDTLSPQQKIAQGESILTLIGKLSGGKTQPKPKPASDNSLPTRPTPNTNKPQ